MIGRATAAAWLVLLSCYAPDVNSYAVVRVADGDTIEVRSTDGEPQRVRFHGIDAPELGQAYGRAAKRELAELVAGANVTLEVRDVDPYDRLVAVVHLTAQTEATNVNAELVRRGYAWVYRRYTDDPELIRLEREAREDQRGLWRDRDPEPPWDWRRRN